MQSVSCVQAVISAGGDVLAGAVAAGAGGGAASGAGSAGALSAAVDDVLPVVAHAIGQKKSDAAAKTARFEIFMVMHLISRVVGTYAETDP